MDTVNISTYKFIDLEDPGTLRRRLLELGRSRSLKGSVLLSPEGINLALAGRRDGIEVIQRWLRDDRRFRDLTFKESLSPAPPFERLKVRVKPEIITFGVPAIRPQQFTGPYIVPGELKRWLDQGRGFTLLDTRNDYEVRLGSFQTALDLHIGSFRELPDAIDRLDVSLRQRPVVIFCTGGVRCEKAAPLMLRRGYTEVYQLQGGVLNYFAHSGAAHWRGECFVFDQRVGLHADLSPSYTRICRHCQRPMATHPPTPCRARLNPVRGPSTRVPRMADA